MANQDYNQNKNPNFNQGQNNQDRNRKSDEGTKRADRDEQGGNERRSPSQNDSDDMGSDRSRRQ